MSTLERLNAEQCDAPDPDHRCLSLEEAGPVLDSLTSKTAQSILVELSDEPGTPGEVADRVDTSLQNVGYHLSKLEDAGLVTVVGTRYSSKGREMSVYASAVRSLVIGSPSGE
ncbi:ArsR/SmtB family transcription factor [Salinigranum halophilum]|jgi:DNA-binding transcriptional ArsR family regulator|uniref:ArsR/SmtB family transcription factor n=1 Tax=Salinigranum halophilum TaxID=2565931 RepID=UPI0010A7BAD8|nr:helix-turn-helix domain-containing protein [Salinigranum halophilum]